MTVFLYRTPDLRNGATWSTSAADIARRAAAALACVDTATGMFGDVRGSPKLHGTVGAAHRGQLEMLRQSSVALGDAAGRAAAAAALAEVTTAATTAAAHAE